MKRIPPSAEEQAMLMRPRISNVVIFRNRQNKIRPYPKRRRSPCSTPKSRSSGSKSSR